MKKKPLSKPQRLRYFLVYKPYGVLSQFTKEGNLKTLKDFGPFPKDVYAAGRLDADSEGLLLLTNDRRLNHILTDPKFAHPRTYLVQVEGIPTEVSLQSLRAGVTVQGQKTLPAEVQILNEDPALAPRSKPIRFRRSIPTSWLQITLHEGKNRQVRRMTAAVGLPTLRLVRTKIESLTLEGLKPGMSRELSFEEISAMTKLLKTPRVSRVFSE